MVNMPKDGCFMVESNYLVLCSIDCLAGMSMSSACARLTWI